MGKYYKYEIILDSRDNLMKMLNYLSGKGSGQTLMMFVDDPSSIYKIFMVNEEDLSSDLLLILKRLFLCDYYSVSVTVVLED